MLNVAAVVVLIAVCLKLIPAYRRRRAAADAATRRRRLERPGHKAYHFYEVRLLGKEHAHEALGRLRDCLALAAGAGRLSAQFRPDQLAARPAQEEFLLTAEIVRPSPSARA